MVRSSFEVSRACHSDAGNRRALNQKRALSDDPVRRSGRHVGTASLDPTGPKQPPRRQVAGPALAGSGHWDLYQR